MIASYNKVFLTCFCHSEEASDGTCTCVRVFVWIVCTVSALYGSFAKKALKKYPPKKYYAILCVSIVCTVLNGSVWGAERSIAILDVIPDKKETSDASNHVLFPMWKVATYNWSTGKSKMRAPQKRKKTWTGSD